jgi:hypothetical protein
VSQPEGAPDQHTLVGRSYTRARRHPWVIGRIQGWTLPLGPFSATQLGVLVLSLWLLIQTAPLYAADDVEQGGIVRRATDAIKQLALGWL